jgi:hypothetical protein
MLLGLLELPVPLAEAPSVVMLTSSCGLLLAPHAPPAA